MPVSEELYNCAKTLKDTVYPQLRTVTPDDIIMPYDYQNMYYVISQLLQSVNVPVRVPPKTINIGDYVSHDHPIELQTIGYDIWNYMNNVLGEPYTTDSDFNNLKTLLDTVPSLKYGSPLTCVEWNTLYDFCRRLIDLILRHPPVVPPAVPNVFIWLKNNILYSGLPPDDLHEIDYTYLDNPQQRRINCCWHLYNMYWIVYFNPISNSICIKTSTDLKTWSTSKTVDTGCSSFEDSLLVGDYLYVVGIKNNNVYLYRVQLLSSGDISVTVMFNFGCTQYPNSLLKRCDFSIRGNEMWFHYFVYIDEFITRIYRRVSYYPFNSVGSETYVTLTMFMPDAIAMINGATYMFAFRQHTYRGFKFIFECHYDGTSWSSESLIGNMYYMFPFNWNNVTYVFITYYDALLYYWTEQGWGSVDYTNVLTENGAYTVALPVIWVESSDKLVGAILQGDPSTSKYRIQYFEIDSSLNITLKQATDWFTDAIDPYSVVDRAVTL
jgi:hypothetical protein